MSPMSTMMVILLVLSSVSIVAKLMPKDAYEDIECTDEFILPSDLLEGTGFMNSVSPPRRCPPTASQHRQLLKAAAINRMGQHFAPVAFPHARPPFGGPIAPAATLPLNHPHGLPVQMALPPFRAPRPKPPKPSVIEYMMLNMYLSAQLDRRRERIERLARCEALCAEMALRDSECPPCAKA